MDYMRDCEDNAFDLAIVDPPYGIGESGKTNASRGKLAIAKDYKPFAGEDREAPGPDYFDALRRVSRNMIIWGANHFIDNLPFMCNSPCWLVWDKVNGSSDFADFEMAWTSHKTAARLFRFQWAGMLQGNMKKKEHRIHPTQKPVKLYDWILSNYAEPGQRILDTHLGSGSSAIAAHYFGVDFVGIEIDEDYYNAARERFDSETAQVDMFAVNSV